MVVCNYYGARGCEHVSVAVAVVLRELPDGQHDACRCLPQNNGVRRRLVQTLQNQPMLVFFFTLMLKDLSPFLLVSFTPSPASTVQMQTWQLLLMLAVIVLAVFSSTAAVGYFYHQGRDCGHPSVDDACSRALRLTSSSSACEGLIAPVVYPSLVLDGDAEYQDAFPLHAPYVVYKPYLSSTALSADIKSNFSFFQPMLESFEASKWSLARCYLLDTTSAAATQIINGGPAMTSALFVATYEVTDSSASGETSQAHGGILMSRPSSAVASGNSTFVMAYYMLADGLVRSKSLTRGDGPAGEATVEFWNPDA